MPKARIIFVAGLLGVCSNAAGADDSKFVCEQNGIERTVEVTRDGGYACRVKYVKPAGTSYPWTARNEADCLPRARGLVDKVRGLGWECDSAADVKSVLNARLEQYQRHLKILANIGKVCHFYPTEARFGDLCGDRRDEAVIVYTCEAAAGAWDQHLAVFLEIEDQPLITEIGDSRSRQVVTYFIDRQRVLLESEYLVPDAGAVAPDGSALQTSLRCSYSSETGWELVEE